MKIAMFSTYDAGGGAARACVRLNYAFLSNPKIEVNYFVKNKIEDSSSTIVLNSRKYSKEVIELDVNKTYINNNRTDLTNTLYSFSYSDVELPDLVDFDILNLHWIEYFISLQNLYELTLLNKPIVWTLHDMKPFTGGCHYSSTCREFEDDCSECQQLVNDKKKLPKSVLQVKHKIFKDANLTIVTPSVWLANEARKSSLFKNKRIEVIPYGIDSAIFKPIDKNIAKKHLGIEEESVVLTFGAISHAEKRKGFSELVQAMSLLKKKLGNKKVIALFFGSSSSDDFPLPVINVGHIDNDEKLSYIYSAADIFILPSLEDNLPNTILESLSCQTPIVAFDTGGAKDIIDNSNGKIVTKGDVQALCDEVYMLIEDEELRTQKGKNGRQLILNKYQLHHQALAYTKLFSELQNENFKYRNLNLDVNSHFEKIIKYTKETLSPKTFMENYNIFFKLVEELKYNNKKYVVYGNGTIGKTIQALIPDKIIGYVDIADEKHHPLNLNNMNYDKIIISVLGREGEIIKYLMQELSIDIDRIVTLEI